jgi:hypothetical protein
MILTAGVALSPEVMFRDHMTLILLVRRKNQTKQTLCYVYEFYKHNKVKHALLIQLYIKTLQVTLK